MLPDLPPSEAGTRKVYEQQKIYDVVVWGVEGVRRDLASLRSLLIDTPGGGHVPLGDVETLEIAPTAPPLIEPARRGRSNSASTCHPS